MSPESRTVADSLDERMPKLLPAEILKLVEEGHFHYDLETKAVYVLLETAGVNLKLTLEQVRDAIAAVHKQTDERVASLLAALDALDRTARVISSVQASSGQVVLARIEQNQREFETQLRLTLHELLRKELSALTQYLREQPPQDERITQVIETNERILTMLQERPAQVTAVGPTAPAAAQSPIRILIGGIIVGFAITAALALLLHFFPI